MRSCAVQLDWEHECFLCCQSINRHVSRCEHHTVTTVPIRGKVIEACTKRNDEWGNEVLMRLQDCFDLVAVKAVYHSACFARFLSGRPMLNSCVKDKSVGRKENHDMLQSFDRVCSWLETKAEPQTRDEIYDRMLDLAEGKPVYSVKWLKKKLSEKYASNVFFAEVAGRKNVVCFQNMASFIISDKWHSDRSDNVSIESDRVIRAAARLILADIREKQYSTDTYPSEQDIKDTDRAIEWMPRSLQILMQELIASKVKQSSIGQCIIRAAKPRSAIPPILLGLGVEMDHVFGSRWLINELSRLGFSVPYDEVVRFKHSSIQAESLTDLLPEHFPDSFTQWVGDNVDHNVATLDGNGTFHGMGIIAVSTKTRSGSTMPTQHSSNMPRLKRILSKALIRDKGIPIVPYVRGLLPGLKGMKYKPILELQMPHTLPKAMHLEGLWHSGWLFSDDSQPRPNWSGFMQDISDGDHPQTSDIRMLPLIDMNSSDETCIYSTLMFIGGQAKN